MTMGDVYFKSNIEGMNNDELILFMYQELLKILNQARLHLEKREIEKRVQSINKAIEVISTLSSILNFEAGEIALRLRALYLFAIQQLTKANFNANQIEAVDDVIRVFRQLHDSWREKIEKDRQAAAGAVGVKREQDGAGGKKVEIYG